MESFTLLQRSSIIYMAAVPLLRTRTSVLSGTGRQVANSNGAALDIHMSASTDATWRLTPVAPPKMEILQDRTMRGTRSMRIARSL